MATSILCSACLFPAPNLIKICGKDANNITWSCKLSSCVPEVRWNEEDLLCSSCINQLEVACAFRNLCLQSLALRNEGYLKNELSDHVYEDSLVDDELTENEEETKVLEHCKYCELQLDDQKSLGKHKKDLHRLECPYECVYCDKNFKTYSDFRQHEKTHSHYECVTCKTSYNTAWILHKHQIIKHTSSDQWKYFCPHCKKKYPFKSNRDIHIRRHHMNSTEVFICFACNKSYSNKLLLVAHVKLKHSNRKYTKQCGLCFDVYINQEALENHLQKKHSVGTTTLNNRVKRYECEKCNKFYMTQKALKGHHANCNGIKRPSRKTRITKSEEEAISNNEEESVVGFARENGSSKEIIDFKSEQEEELNYQADKSSIIKNEKEPVVKRGRKKLEQHSNKCGICGMVFNTQYLAKRHIRNVHATEKNYQCDICKQKFASPVYLNAHKRYHSGERPHICSFCGKGFITGSDLYHHEKIHANKRAYKCDKCPKAFNTSSDLHKHKLCVHQDRNEWKYVCTFCDRRFPLKTNLDAHTKTHTGERNFACHLCDRRCVNRSVLLRHIKSHSNVRLFKCNLCNMEYKYQKSLDIHMTKAHGIGDAKIPERVKKYFCHICPKSYFANNKLQKHIRTHTGERPFSCQMCEKRFIDKSYVKQHLKTAHNVIFSETDI